MAESPIPIAVIGMACRFPGGANCPEKLWQMLAEGREAWSDVPEDRFNWKAFHHHDPDMVESSNHRGGHFINQDIAAFDAKFFGIPALEAEAMDPQHRIQLEVAYEALENSGTSLKRIKKSNTAVYVATFNHDYHTMLLRDTTDLPKYQILGTGQAIIANRISYTFDLKGPSVNLDTGCSGSMVALHQACQSLRSGESDMALVGGANIILNPDIMTAMSTFHMLDDNGKSYSFDNRGTGYGRGEGVGMLIVKRLGDALEAGDPIRSVIRNTGVNQDGKTNGMTLPSGEAQQNLIRSVYEKGGLDIRHTGYVEAHGTGTIAGDGIEIEAIAEAFCTNIGRVDPLFVGSIKANIGHLESASGIAGLIKAIMILEKGLLPPNVNFITPKEGLSLESRNIKIISELEPWTTLSQRRISVNSFGYGGTNAHAILDAGSHTSCAGRRRGGLRTELSRGNSENIKSMTPIKASSTGPFLFVISAKSKSSLTGIANNVRDWCCDRHDSDRDLACLAYTLSSRRSRWHWRASLVATNCRELETELDLSRLSMTEAKTKHRVVFMFTGQGAQWHAMGRELNSVSAVFHESLQHSDELLRRLGASWSLLEELSRGQEESRVDGSEIGQPACTAIQIALVRLLDSLAIKPDAVLGHSSGEIAAAYACGALSQETALMVSYRRGLLSTPPNGAMISVGLDEKGASGYLQRLGKGTVCVACINSPSITTISGDRAAILELQDILNADAISNTLLKVDKAYHSHHMQSSADEYLRSLGCMTFRVPKDSIPFFSSVTAGLKSSDFGSNYWAENLVAKVRFIESLTELCGAMATNSRHGAMTQIHLVEIGPHNTLVSFSKQTETILPHDLLTYEYHACLRRRADARVTVLGLVGSLFEHGYLVDLEAANALEGSQLTNQLITDLEPYSWDHSNTYWHESRLSKEHRLRSNGHHELLGVRIVSSTSLEPRWRNVMSAANLPWLRDHSIQGLDIFPGSGYICMAVEALRQIHEERKRPVEVTQYVLKDVSFKKELVIPDPPETVEVQLSLRTSIEETDELGSPMEEFRISAFSNGRSWHEHCRGFISISTSAEIPKDRNGHLVATHFESRIEETRRLCEREIEVSNLYDKLRQNGNNYGPSFAKLKDLVVGKRHAIGSVENTISRKPMDLSISQAYAIHPTTLDALLHSCLPLYAQLCGSSSVMTVSIPALTISTNIADKPSLDLLVTTSLTATSPSSAQAEISAFQANVDSGQLRVVNFIDSAFRGLPSTEASDFGPPANPGISWQKQWNVDVDFLQSTAFTSQFYDDAEQHLIESRTRLLDEAATFYIDTCLAQLTALTESVPQDYRTYMIDWMRRHQASEYSQKLKMASPASCRKNLIEKSRHAGVQGEILWRIGRNLTSILTGRLEPLSILLEDDLLYHMYAADDSSSQCFTHMVRYLKLLIFKRPNMNVLEIGAGTGSATLPLLQAVSNSDLVLGHYDFTDVTSGFFERAQSLLHKWKDLVRFKTLNIETDPTDQGFTGEGYDLIVASNVLHATSRIGNTLANIRKLLKPWGTLLIIELTRDVAFYNTCFGVLPGWWAGVNEGRMDSPLLSKSQWHDALIHGSFTGLEVTADDYIGSAQRSTMMVSKAARATAHTVPPPLEILYNDDSSSNVSDFAQHMLPMFETHGYQSSIGSWPSVHVSEHTLYVVLDCAEKPLLLNLSPAIFASLATLASEATKVLWITIQDGISSSSNPEKGLVTGLARSAWVENQASRMITLDLQQEWLDATVLIIEIVERSFGTNSGVRPIELEYIFKDGQLEIPRLVPDFKVNTQILGLGHFSEVEVGSLHQPSRPLKLVSGRPSIPNELYFEDDERLQRPMKPFEVEIEVQASGLGLREVTTILGQENPSDSDASECAGVVTGVGQDFKCLYQVGDRVCAWGDVAIASRIRIHGHCICHLSATMSFIEGASFPIATLIAYHSLTRMADLRKGHSLLIQSAASGVGQAAVYIAQDIGADVFVLNETDCEGQILSQGFELPEDHVLTRKSLATQEHHNTMDVILTPTGGDSIQHLVTYIARFGTIVGLGKPASIRLPAAIIAKSATFATVNFGLLVNHRREETGVLMRMLMDKYGERISRIKTSSITMPIANIGEAFSLIQNSKPSANVILDENSDSRVSVLSRRIPPSQLLGDATYIVAGGLGGVGLEFSRLMARRGAKHLVIFSRRVLDEEALRHVVDDLQSLGATLKVISCDISDISQLRQAQFNLMVDMPPVRGIVQAAMVLNPSLLKTMTLEDFQVALYPKVKGTRALSEVFDSSNLDFFIMLSSSIAILGSKGFVNYACGNAFQDAFANSQEASRTNIISLNLALWEDASIVAKTSKVMQGMIREGFIPITTAQLHALLDYTISPQIQEDRCRQLIVGFNRQSILESEIEHALKIPMFSNLSYQTEVEVKGDSPIPLNSVNDAIESAQSLAEVRHIVGKSVVQKIAALLAAEEDKIDLQTSMVDLGLDSFIAIELRNWIMRTFKATLQISEVTDASHIEALVAKVSERSALINQGIKS